MTGVAWGLAAAAAVALVVAVNARRFRRRVAADARELWAAPAPPAALRRERWRELPRPVARYAALAVGGRSSAVGTVRLRHGGAFRPRLDGPWLPIHGLEYFSASPPGFVWWGRARVGPGMWVEARDRSLDGRGRMTVIAESTVTLADATGPELDQGAALRLLAEMVWFPTALVDERHVSWSAVDATRAQATLRLGGRSVRAAFRFGRDGLPAAVFAERHRDLGGSRWGLTRWSGEYSDYREVAGLRVPFGVVVFWHVDGAPRPYARFTLERVEYDVAEPFAD